MSLIIRSPEPADLDGLYRVWSVTYNNGKPFEPERKVFKHAAPFVAVRGDEVVGGFGVLEMEVTRQKATLPCMGVLAVAVAPEVRHIGVGKEMMSWGVRHYRERGFPFAALYPFSPAYYRKFGYELCGRRVQIKLQSARFPSIKQELPVRTIPLNDPEPIKPCYEAFAVARSGVNLRPKTQWERALNPESNRTLYVAGDPVEAYALIQHSQDFWNEQRIDEFVWSTLRGYETMLSFFKGLGINKTHVLWSEPSDGVYSQKYAGLGAEVQRHEPPAMFRCLNVADSIARLKPATSGEFTIQVFDELVAENQVPLKVSFEPGRVEVQPTSAGSLTMDIRQFSQAFLGEPSLEDLLRTGVAQCSSASEAEAAMRLFTPCPVMCVDMF